MASVSFLPCYDSSKVLYLSSQSSYVPTSRSYGEPHPKRLKLLDEKDEECEGWDRWGEKEYLIYSYKFMKSKLDDDVEFFRFLENHVRKNRGFEIDACPPTCYAMFSLVLPPDAPPIPQELKDFPTIDPTRAEYCLQHVYALAKSAVEFQNGEKGSKLEFVKVLKAFTFATLGRYYYITLVALDKRTGDYKKCQTRVFTSLQSRAPMILYGVDSFWVKGKVDAAIPEVPQSWPSRWKLTRLREDEMRRPYRDPLEVQV